MVMVEGEIRGSSSGKISTNVEEKDEEVVEDEDDVVGEVAEDEEEDGEVGRGG